MNLQENGHPQRLDKWTYGIPHVTTHFAKFLRKNSSIRNGPYFLYETTFVRKDTNVSNYVHENSVVVKKLTLTIKFREQQLELKTFPCLEIVQYTTQTILWLIFEPLDRK